MIFIRELITVRRSVLFRFIRGMRMFRDAGRDRSFCLQKMLCCRYFRKQRIGGRRCNFVGKGRKSMEEQLSGLTEQEVRERRERGEGGAPPSSITKTKSQIFRENILTLFNF